MYNGFLQPHCHMRAPANPEISGNVSQIDPEGFILPAISASDNTQMSSERGAGLRETAVLHYLIWNANDNLYSFAPLKTAKRVIPKH